MTEKERSGKFRRIFKWSKKKEAVVKVQVNAGVKEIEASIASLPVIKKVDGEESEVKEEGTSMARVITRDIAIVAF